MSEHKFRYLLPPGTEFRFVDKFKAWIWLSVVLTAATVGVLFVNKAVRGEYMNWTIDFKGGTELIFAFKDKQGEFTQVDPAKVRAALAAAGEEGTELSGIDYTESTGHGDVTVHGLIVKTTRVSALRPDAQARATTDFVARFADRDVGKATWSGERLFVRSKRPITNVEATSVFAGAGLELEAWSPQEVDLYTHADEGTHEYNEVFAMRGLDQQFTQLLAKGLGDVRPTAVQSYAVGAKAGDRLRDDAAKSLIYALALIMLYLAFRFDVRYAPGAAFAMVHDAVMVIGVFAATWTEVSLTTVAGLLTVMGYSVNETVISFDRIRENEHKLKGKSLERIIDISINERLTRTIMTALTVFATTLIMNIFGTGSVKNFAFAMNVGVIVATYSSIFLAAPIFLWISKKWYSGPPKRRRSPPVAAPEAPAADPS
jgi:preprotein translocase subunit SecF